MTEEQINELGNEYANKIEYPDYVEAYDGDLLHKHDDVADLVSKVHAAGIRKGISIAVNAIEKSKSDISESVTKAILDVLQKCR